jgi:hypothetical protein
MLFAPVELEGFARLELERHIGFDQAAPPSPPAPDELGDPAVAPSKPAAVTSPNSFSAVRRSRWDAVHPLPGHLDELRRERRDLGVADLRRRYFGSTPSGAFSHFRIVLRVSPVRRSISDSVQPHPGNTVFLLSPANSW